MPGAPHASVPSLARRTLLGLGAGLLAAATPLGRIGYALAAAPTHKRLVVVILRGGLDGLAAVAPYGDPGLGTARGQFVLPEPGREGGLLDLGGRFGLHPALSAMHEMYRRNEMLVVHAIASNYRGRSHFDGQDVLESGAERRLSEGWLNRAIQLMPGGSAPAPRQRGANAPGPGARSAGGPNAGGARLGIAVGAQMPLVMKGAAPVGSFAPQILPEPEPDLLDRLATLYQRDRVLAPALAEARKANAFSSATLGQGRREGAGRGAGAAAWRGLCANAGRLLAAADGPRVCALEVGGWDTHAGQQGRLAAALGVLDAGMGALKTGLGAAWRETVVMVMTEFGRTVAVNGTGGTDHGTGGVAFLLGGAVAGGRVQATWPGLGAGRLFQNRDLAPTADLRALAKGVLRQHLGLDAPRLDQLVFPASAAAVPMARLLRA
ncbi:MAG: DUF1501 domain-containing protein [Alphaproteobacteria bacterium]|nr:DUF1501 domain-containing protein [Alphaproteobacteria bacterium]